MPIIRLNCEARAATGGTARRRTLLRAGRLPSVLWILLTLGGIPSGLPADPAKVPDRPLRVATGPIAPFVFERGDQLSGFSIDLWNEVARRMKADFTWVPIGLRAEQIEAVRRGDADLAISALEMTPERVRLVDFSQSYFDSGLQIMVRAEDEGRMLDTLNAIPWGAVGRLFAAAIVLMLLWAHVLWFGEFRRDPRFGRKYLAGIGEGLWHTVLIIATGEHGDRNAPGTAQRLVVVCVWLMGIVLIAQLTATVTSYETIRRFRSIITGPGDLPGKTIATVPGTVASEYLTRLHLPVVEVASAADGIALVARGGAQAFVYDAPTLQYRAAESGNSALQVVGPVFRPEKYGIVLPLGSPLRLEINRALLEIYQDGTYEEIHRKWFTRVR